jgi:hypothetical protein
MSVPVRDWALLVVVTAATTPVSAFIWLIGGMSMCGEEAYNTPPGSVGDSLCGALVEPIAPWATLAAIPTILVAVGGVVAIRRGQASRLAVFLGSVYLLAVLMALAFTASS